MSIDLESLGFTKEELQERVIDRLCDEFLHDKDFDAGWLAGQVKDKVKEAIQDSVNALAETHILPNVRAYIETLVLTETNGWGEKKKEYTFIEYLTKKANDYISEKVDFDGKPKDAGSYGWSGKQTRIAHMIHNHLHYNIDSAVKDAIKNANSVLVKGIEDTVKIKLNEIAKSLKVGVNF